MMSAVTSDWQRLPARLVFWALSKVWFAHRLVQLQNEANQWRCWPNAPHRIV